VLLIYTGGTIGMMEDPATGALAPIDFAHLHDMLPVLEQFDYGIQTLAFEPPIDSSDMNPAIWAKLGSIIEREYDRFRGFVVLHGTDTMSYTASALSFMLQNLGKPVILTGSQLPIDKLRTDGKENLVTAIEIAGAHKNGQPLVPEVCVYFENELYRGNRTYKRSALHFNAFESPNYPVLARAGIEISYNYAYIHYPTTRKALVVHKRFCPDVVVLKIYPGITRATVGTLLNVPGAKAVLLETFGSGNAPTEPWFVEEVAAAVRRGLVVLNVSQCNEGGVDMGKYQTGIQLLKAGVVSAGDMTLSAAVTKLMFLLGKGLGYQGTVEALADSMAGEMTLPQAREMPTRLGGA